MKGDIMSAINYNDGYDTFRVELKMKSGWVNCYGDKTYATIGWAGVKCKDILDLGYTARIVKYENGEWKEVKE